MTNDQKKQLEAQLWNIADTLRGKMNADEFRDYCLGFIFYKYLSERQYIYANEILSEDDLDYLDIDENSELGQAYLEAVKDESITKLGYFLKPSELFHSLAIRALGAKKAEEDNLKDEDFAQSNFILDDLTQVLNSIEKSTMGNESEEDFDHLFEDLDLTSTKLGRTPKDKNALIAKILVHLDKIDFRLKDSESDVLGDAYEYLIAQFATGAGKKAGEFYTPQGVSKVLAKIVTTGKERLKSVYDPTCGSGSLLLRVAKEVKQVGDYFGQEMNRTTYNLARMNMILHGVHYGNFNLCQEDTLERPQHLGKKFEAVVANPPFSANWSANKLFESDDRFSQYGALAPKSKADFAFVQHMIHHLADNGMMAVVLPHGVLFRGATEGRIRQYLIKERNWLDAVIGLPANIFYGTSIPTCILVFKKCREYPNDILFIDGSGHFEKAKNQNYLRDQDIDKIINTYRGRLVEERYSYRASLAEIAENDFNLNIPRYVDTFEEEEDINLADIVGELKEIDQEITEVDLVIQEFCQELNIDRVLSVDNTGKKKVPLLRFPEFSGEWEKKKLKQISSISSGVTPLRSNSLFFDNADIPWVKTTDLNNSEIWQTEECISEIALKETSARKNPVGSILIGMYGGFNQIGRTGLLKIEAATNQALSVVYPVKNINSWYLLHYLNRNVGLWRRFAASSRKDPNITSKDVGDFSVVFPKIEEQEKIAQFLGECDRILTLLRRKRELLESYKRGVMQLLFSQKIRFKNDDGSDFPAWEVKKLGDLLTIRYGKDHKDLPDGNYPVLGTGGIMRYVNSYLYDKPSILIGRKGTIDKPQFVTYPFWTVDTLFYSEIKTNIIPFFLFLVVQSINWMKYNEATGVPSLNTVSINNIKVIIPFDIKEQEKIANFLTAIDKKIEAVGRQIEGRGKFKQGLLQKMFV